MRSLVWIGLGVTALVSPGCAMFGGGQPADDTTKITENTPVSPDLAAKPVDAVPYKPTPVDPGPPAAPAPAYPAPADPYPPAVTPAPAVGPAPVAGGRYVVQRGDTLYLIASKVYFAQSKRDQNVGAGRIYDANRAAIGPNKDKLLVGQTLSIPAASADFGPVPAYSSEPAKSVKKKK